VRAIVGRASTMTAVDVFAGMYRLEGLRRQAGAQWAGMDVLVLPTTGTMYRHAGGGQAIRSGSRHQPRYYTNSCNLLGLLRARGAAGGARAGCRSGAARLIAPRGFHDERLVAPPIRLWRQ